MVRCRSLIGLLLGTVLLVLCIVGAGAGWACTAAQRATGSARDGRLLAAAAVAATRLATHADAARWTPQTAFPPGEPPLDGVMSVQVLVPAADAPGHWRTLFAIPERPDAALPLSDPAVQQIIGPIRAPATTGLGIHEPITWLDPAGTAWRSAICPVNDANGATRALVEARAGDAASASDAVLWLPLGIACVVGLGGALLVARRLLRTVAELADGRTARPAEAEFSDGLPHHPQPSPADRQPSPEDEGSSRHIRLQRELAGLRSQMTRVQGADRAKTALLVALCRSLRQSVETLRSSGSLIAQTRLDRTQREYVDSLQAGCGDLLTRIGDVLDFALLEAECLSLDQRPFRPRLVLEEALAIVAERCAQFPIELAWIAEPSVPERVIGDLPRVRQVLVNLISLAATTAEEGTVSVQLGIEADGRLVFRISLMGVTLTAERIRLLLEGAISSDSSDRLHGEGLGLVLGKRLAQAMGGSLTIERGEDEVITLLCVLRVMPDDVAPERPLQGFLVLVAHDRPATAQMIVSILERAGGSVESVATREALLARAHNEPRPSALIASSRLVAVDAGLDAAGLAAGVSLLGGGPPLLLVVDPIHRGMSAELRAAGAASLLSMPVRQQALLSGTTDAVSGITRDSNLLPVFSGDELHRRVLVVEDNAVNQLVLVRMLESMSIQPEIAANGREAVDLAIAGALANRPYALILMDCMMPVMDGLEATRRIRQIEQREPRVWIVAVTANALANDRAKCLESGMDDYLAKPVTPRSLADALTRWREATGMVRRGSAKLPAITSHGAPPSSTPNPVPTPPPASGAPAQVTDFTGLRTLTRLAGPAAMAEVVGCFLAEAEGMATAVRAAAGRDETDPIRLAAHKLKGSCGTVGLRAAQHEAGVIEQAARAGDLATVRAQLAPLDERLAEGLRLLAEFRAAMVG